MVTRNLTDKFHMFRNAKHDPNDLLLKVGHVDSSVNIDIPNNESLAQEWVGFVDTIRVDMERIKDNSKSFFLFFVWFWWFNKFFEVKRLGDFHQCRLKVSFDDHNELEKNHDIDILTQQTTMVLNKRYIYVYYNVS